MPALYSYVVDHDYGFAPNPFGGFCTLAKGKYGSNKRNIVEIAEVGDWIVGIGGGGVCRSAGRGERRCAPRGAEIRPPSDYCQARNGDRIDAEPEQDGDNRFALISHHFFYFGRNAIDISEIPRTHLDHPLEKSGPGHRCDFREEFVEEFAKWLKATFK